MYTIELEDWEKESGHFLAIGKKVLNNSNQVKYEVSDLSMGGLVFKKIPYFINEKAEPLEISFEELHKAFTEDVLLIEGFESGQSRELKIAIASLIKKIKLFDKDRQLQEKDIRYQEKDEELARIKAEGDERKRLEEEERQRKEAEAKKKEDENKERIRLEEEARKKAEEEKLLHRKHLAAEMETKLIEIELTL